MDDAVTFKLSRPVQFGEEAISELKVKPNARSMRDLGLQMKGDSTIIYEPYNLAKVGVHMAGQPNAVLDLMHPRDVMELSGLVMGFFGLGPGIGTEPSP